MKLIRTFEGHSSKCKDCDCDCKDCKCKDCKCKECKSHKKEKKMNEEFDPLVIEWGSIILAAAASFAFAYFRDRKSAINAFYTTIADKTGQSVEEVKAELKKDPKKKAELKKALSKLNQGISDALGRSLGVTEDF
jgi:hypothetical protein